jgi:hypothetical protein
LRGRSYNTGTRWLTSTVDISYDLALARRVVRVQHPIETTTLGFAVAVEEAPEPTRYSVPVQPIMDAYPGFVSESFGSDFPTGGTANDEQPITQEDLAPQSDAKDPSITITIIEKTSGQTVMVWSTSNLWRTDTIGQISDPVWEDSRWNVLGTGTLEDAVWDGGDNVGAAAWCVSNDGTDSYSYSTTNVAKAFWLATATIDDFEASTIRTSEDSTHTGPASSNASGVYESGNDRYVGQDGDDGGKACNIAFAIPPGSTLTNINVRFEGVRGSTIGGERTCSMQIDGNSTFWTGDFSVALGLQTFTSGNQTPSPTTGDEIIIHSSMDRETNSDARITEVEVSGTSVADHAATAISTDRAATFDPLRDVGLMDLGDGSFDIRRGTWALAAKNEKVRIAFPGLSYSDEPDGGAGSGQYPLAIWGIGDDKDDYIYCVDDGTLYIVIDGSRATITPSGGVLVGPNAICANGQSHIWGIFDYSGTRKVSYSTNGGVDWTDSTTAINSSSVAIRVRTGNNNTVYVAGGSIIYYSSNGGVSFIAKTAPASDITGIAVR